MVKIKNTFKKLKDDFKKRFSNGVPVCKACIIIR